MGRHSLTDEETGARTGPPRARGRRTVVIATTLVVAVLAGAALAVRGGLIPLGDSCAKDAVDLKVAASPDIAPALREAADYARDHAITSDGNCLDVEISARDSSKVTASLREGRRPDFQAWVPDSGIWVDQQSDAPAGVRASATGAIASTPVALGMTKKAAASLGWPKKTYTWAQLAAAGLSGDRPRLGSADPARSAAGLLALTKVTQSAAGSGAQGSAQVAAAAKILAHRTVDSDSQVLDTLARNDSRAEGGNPERNDALVLTEQAAYAYNSEGGSTLDLFYPKDGSPALDYPYTIVDSTKLSTKHSRAAVRFMTLMGEEAGREILRKHGFRPQDGGVDRPVAQAAGARGPQPYTSPPDEAPSVKALQETRGLWTITVQSARLTVVVDASASMAEPVPDTGRTRMEVTKSSLLQALAQFTPQDDIGLWEFATRLEGDRDYEELVPTDRLGSRKDGGKTQRDRLTAAFGALQPVPGGATGLYDTTLAAYEKARANWDKDKFNAVVLLTDGANEDPGSISRKKLIAKLTSLADPAHPLPMVAIAVGPDADLEEVSALARATGGSGHQVDDPAQINEVINNAIVEAGNQQNG
ncbi:substrate-binding and VWA domain-containing protein [Streptomyces sp. NPDC049954]|uniref:substrate-binding and VWA domain-containing protein n=1 Tax=Streptomyces sp. NPDC049954 TaxID=3155779 RepID=UPI003432517C